MMIFCCPLEWSWIIGCVNHTQACGFGLAEKKVYDVRPVVMYSPGQWCSWWQVIKANAGWEFAVVDLFRG